MYSLQMSISTFYSNLRQCSLPPPIRPSCHLPSLPPAPSDPSACPSLPPSLLSLLPQDDSTGMYDHLIGIPKALLPARPGVNGDTILDCWWNALKRCVCTCACSPYSLPPSLPPSVSMVTCQSSAIQRGLFSHQCSQVSAD